MFDEGNNVVTVNLPASVDRERRERDALIREFSNNSSLGSTDPMAELTKQVMPVREYSIDKWNGRAGLKYWNYDESEPNADK